MADEPTTTPTTTGAATTTAGTTTGTSAPSVEEAAQLLAAFKEAGIENPKGALDTIHKLRAYEKGDKLPDSVATQLKDLQKRVSDAENAKLSDVEQLQQKIADLEAATKASEDKAATVTRNAAITAAARAAGAIDPDAMPRLIDPSDVTYDKKTGEPNNLAELLDDLKKSKPQWFGGPASFDGGVRGAASSGVVDMEQALRAAAGH